MSLQIGQKLPYFSGVDQYGDELKSSDFSGKTLVVFFYVKDFTPGCTKEVCAFEEEVTTLDALDAAIIGISSDPVEKHHRFSQTHDLTFPLVADTNERIRRLFGVKPHFLGLIPGRETFIFDKNSILQFKWRHLGAQLHLKKSLNFIKQLS